jgi:hypothetical protein
MDFITEDDRLLARIILAMQAETGLEMVSVEKLARHLAETARRCPAAGDILPTSDEDALSRVSRLAAAGWLSLDSSNPHVTLTVPGLMFCGALRIPPVLSTALGEFTPEALR